MIRQAETLEPCDYFDENNVHQSVAVLGVPRLRLYRKEQTIAEMAEIIGIDASRIHKTVEVQFHVHDCTKDELEAILAMTAGQRMLPLSPP